MYFKRFPLEVLFLIFALTGIPQSGWATAIVNSALAFSNLQIAPTIGTLQITSPWALIAFSEAQNSLGELDQDFDFRSSPDTVFVKSEVTWAEGQATASAPNDPPDLNVTGDAASLVDIPGKITGAASSLGRGTLINEFTITGGTGPVGVDFSVDLDGLLRVLTDQYGVLAETEVIFGLELDGKKLLFFKDRLSVGPNSAIARTVDQTLTAKKTLAYGVPYSLYLEVDSESRGINIPELSTPALLLMSMGLVVAGFCLKCRNKTGDISHLGSNSQQ